MKPLLIGEAPSRTSDPARAFSGRSGDRLRGLLGRELEDVFEPINLLDRWPGPAARGSGFSRWEARARALSLLVEWPPTRLYVLVGRRVAQAFALDYPYFEVVGVRHPSVVIPHPSTANAWWNDTGNVETARAFLRALVP